MPYSPPTSPLNISWTGAPAYGGAKGTVRGSWDTTGAQYVFPPGAEPGAAGISLVRWGQFVTAPQGIQPGSVGAAFTLRRPYLYRPAQSPVNASWLGAEAYTAPVGTASVVFDLTLRILAPGGLAAGSAGTPVLRWQQFISPPGLSSQDFGTATYVLRPYEYKPPQWVVNATWVGAESYVTPTSPINAAFTPPVADTIVSAVGFDSSAFGTATAYNGSRQLLVSGIASAEAFGAANTFLKQRFVTPGGIASALYGTAFVSNWVRTLLPAGFTGAVPGPTVVNTRATQTVAPGGLFAGAWGTPSISPRFVFATGIAGQIGTPFVTRNPSPLGIDSAAYGVPAVEYRTKVLQPGGIYEGDFGLPAYGNRPQTVFGAGIDQTALLGDHSLRNTRQVAAPLGDDYSFISPFAEVSNRNRALLPFGVQPGPIASAFSTEDPPQLFDDALAPYMRHLVADDTWTYLLRSVTQTMPAGLVAENSAIADNGTYVATLALTDTAFIMRVYEKATGVQEALVRCVTTADTSYVEFSDRHGASSFVSRGSPIRGVGAGLAVVTGGFAMRTGSENVVWRPGRVFTTAGNVNAYRVDGGRWAIECNTSPNTTTVRELSASADSATGSYTWTNTAFSKYGAAILGDALYFIGTWSGAEGLHKIDLTTGALVTTVDIGAGWPDIPRDSTPEVVAADGKVFVHARSVLRVFDASLTEVRAPRFTDISTSTAIYDVGPGPRAVAYNGYLTIGTQARVVGSGPTVTRRWLSVFRTSDGKLHRPPSIFELTNVWTYSPNISPAGIDSLLMGRASETGVGAPIRTLVPTGADQLRFGTAALTRTPSLEPAGIVGTAFGTAMVAPRVRTVQTQGRVDSLFGEPTAWFRVRYLRDAGRQDLALYGVPRVESTIRAVEDATSGNTANYGTSTVWFKVRSLAPEGIAFELSRQFGAARVQDARQTVGSAGIAGRETFGTHSIARNERVLTAQGFAGAIGAPAVDWLKRYVLARGADAADSGVPLVYNARQYITGYTPADEAAYGRVEVVNRNRTILTYGTDTSKLPSGAVVENKARVLLAQGFVGSFGTPFAAERVRYVAQLGHEDSRFSVWASVYNSMRRLEPSGVGRGAPGVPRVWDNTQRIDTADGGVDTSLWGQPFVADRVRVLDIDRFGVAVPAWPDPYVGLYTRRVAPPGAESEFGSPVVEERRNIIALHGADEARYGGAFVKNKTPQLYVGSQEPPTNPQRPYVGFRVRPAPVEGFDASLYGRAAVQMRTRYVTPNGVLTQRIGLQTVAFDAPQIPPQQLIAPFGIIAGIVPDADFNLRGAIVPGIDAARYGTASVRTNVLYVESVELAMSKQVGKPSLNATQYAKPFSIDSSTVPAPMMWPYILRISEDAQGVLVAPEALMDFPDLPRPLFGRADVQLKNRRIFQGNDFARYSAYGFPFVSLRRRTVAPKGIAPRRFGIPELPSNWEIQPYWGSNPGDGPEPARFGLPAISRPYVYDPNLRAAGFVATEWGDASVELFIRVVRPTGSAGFAPGLPWVHPPIRLYPAGFREQWGGAWVSYKNRIVQPVGFDASRWGYEAGGWTFPTMRVAHRYAPAAFGIAPPDIARHAIYNAQLGTIATLGDTSSIGKPRVGACTC